LKYILAYATLLQAFLEALLAFGGPVVVVATRQTANVIMLYLHELRWTLPEKERVGLCINLLKQECRVN
jgi:hypothetical protein